MKTQTIKISLMLCLGISIFACEQHSRRIAVSEAASLDESGTSEVRSAGDLEGETFRLRTLRQDVVISKLGELIWDQITCQTEAPESKGSTRGLLILNFYPDFVVTWRPDLSRDSEETILSPYEICGEPSSKGRARTVTRGILKRDSQNQFKLLYGVNPDHSMRVSMTWDGNQKNAGSLICLKQNQEIKKAILRDCTVTPLQFDPE